MKTFYRTLFRTFGGALAGGSRRGGSLTAVAFLTMVRSFGVLQLHLYRLCGGYQWVRYLQCRTNMQPLGEVTRLPTKSTLLAADGALGDDDVDVCDRGLQCQSRHGVAVWCALSGVVTTTFTATTVVFEEVTEA